MHIVASLRPGGTMAYAHDCHHHHSSFSTQRHALSLCLSARHHQQLRQAQSTRGIDAATSWPSIRISDPQVGQGPVAPKSARVVARAVDSTQSTSSATAKSVVPDDEFSLAKVSFGVIGMGGGVSLLSYGFGAYFNILPGSEWSALMLTYGFPLAIIGMALKYAELKPVPCLTYSDAQKLRETCATPILKQVRNDVTRYRYGDEQHLDEALKRIFQYGLGGGIPRRSAPVLQMVREEVTEEGKYCLVLVFEAKALQLSDFEQRQAKFASFFGPGISTEIAKGEKDLYEVRLISNTAPDASSQ